jgi:hypothetical protein
VPSKKWYSPINFNNIVFVIAKDNNMMQPYKTLLIDTLDLENVQGNKKKENVQDIKLAQISCQNFSMSKIDRLV